jgi:hypothetical protein
MKDKMTVFAPVNFTGITEHSDGTEFANNYVLINHYKNGELHNEKTAAVVWNDGKKLWYLNGVRYFQKDWKIEVGKLVKNRIFFK